MLIAPEIGKRRKLWNEHDKARKEHDEMSDQFQKIWLEYMKREYKYRALFIILSKGKVNESDLESQLEKEQCFSIFAFIEVMEELEKMEGIQFIPEE